MFERAIVRRQFLKKLGFAGAGVMLGSLLPAARRALGSDERGSGLIVRNDWPEHWETSLAALGRAWLTPNDAFFVRSHFVPPSVDMATWRLEVSGRVRTPLSMSLAELRAMTPVEMVCVLECAGNGRSAFALPSTSGTQWGLGAVGNARWKGVRLASVLERAGLEPDAAHVWFECADAAPLPETPRFVRSIPLQKVADDVLLAWEMNGVPLPRRHGAPLRAIVPGWFGMASAKWVTRIRIETEPSDNHFMVRGYRYVYPGEDPASAPPVDELRIKSVITRPREGEKLSIKKLSVGKPATGKQSVVKARIMGFAWAGSKGIKLVEISSDGGSTWQAAGFMGDTEPHSWRLWATEVPIAAGKSVTVIARATDNAGQVQPAEAHPNAGGYGNNSMHRVTFRAVA